jgi:hypothetical protein
MLIPLLVLLAAAPPAKPVKGAPVTVSSAPASMRLEDALAAIDPQRMKTTVEKLVSFGTRHLLSDTVSATRGIGAARRWVFDELSRYASESGGRMTVELQSSMQQSKRTSDTPVEVTNVVATIRGTSDPHRVYIATGHLDSRNTDIMDSTSDAPGADDDASGVAVIMEVARVLSKVPARATIILAAVAGEEQGLLGSKGLAEAAVAKQWNVEGMITNDIVGGIEGGSGRIDTHTIRVFSANTKGVGESTSRHLARFVKEQAASILPGIQTRLVYRLDRFGRGGDHISFFEKGFPAIRFCEANENYRRQHQNVRMEGAVQYGDLPQYVSGDYMKLVASLNAVTLARAAAAPAAPKGVTVEGAVSDDTTLSWTPGTDADLAGYEIVIRETTADEWQRVVPVGSVWRFTFRNLPLDNLFFGVRSVDGDGNRSPVRTPDEK